MRKFVAEEMGCVGPGGQKPRGGPGAQDREDLFPRLSKPGRASGGSRVSPRKGQWCQQRV